MVRATGGWLCTGPVSRGCECCGSTLGAGSEPGSELGAAGLIATGVRASCLPCVVWMRAPSGRGKGGAAARMVASSDATDRGAGGCRCW